MRAAQGIGGRSGAFRAGALLGVGAVSFALGLALRPAAAWAALLVNLLYWAGLAQGAAVFVAILALTEARWARASERLAGPLALFLPVAVPLVALLWPGREALFPWLELPDRSPWLQPAPLLLRDALALAAMAAASLALLRARSRPEARGRAVPLAAAVLLLDLLAGSLLAVDLAMSLEPGFRSTIFPLHFLAGGVASALGATALLAAFARRPDVAPTPEERTDLGNLLWTFLLLVGYFGWSQFFVFWMGNLRAEAGYHLERWHATPWSALAWSALVVGLLLPGAFLFSGRVKRSGAALGAVGGLVAAGIFLQRCLEVLPALGVPRDPVGTLLFAGVFPGFAGAVALVVLRFRGTVAPAPLPAPAPFGDGRSAAASAAPRA